MLDKEQTPIEQVEERIAELRGMMQVYIDIKQDRKLDRYEYPKFKVIQNLLFINQSFLHSLKRNSEYILQ